jgi:hypothetical protein
LLFFEIAKEAIFIISAQAVVEKLTEYQINTQLFNLLADPFDTQNFPTKAFFTNIIIISSGSPPIRRASPPAARSRSVSAD